MKRTSFLAFVLLFAPWISSAQRSFATAQTATDSQAPATFTINVLPGLGNCPAIMRARHEAGLHARMYVRRNPQAQGPALGLVLTLVGGRALITHATVVVHGLNGKGHLLQTSRRRDGPPEATGTLDLAFTRNEDNSVSAYLLLPGFTAVNSIDLVTATYADGSTWTPAAGRACQVTPDPFMIVAAQ